MIVPSEVQGVVKLVQVELPIPNLLILSVAVLPNIKFTTLDAILQIAKIVVGSHADIIKASVEPVNVPADPLLFISHNAIVKLSEIVVLFGANLGCPVFEDALENT